MYDFQKRPNASDTHEFSHYNFCRDAPKKLGLIKRKNSNQSVLRRSEYSQNGRNSSLMDQIETLNGQISRMAAAHEQLRVHNNLLAEANKNLFVNLSLRKGSSLAKMQKLLFILFVLLEDYNPRCVYGIKMEIFRSNIGSDYNNLDIFDILLRVKNFINNFLQQMNDSQVMTSEYLDKIFETFCGLITDKTKNWNFEVFLPFFNGIAQILNLTNMSELLLNESIGIQEVLAAHSKRFLEVKDFFTSRPLFSGTEFQNLDDSESSAFSWAPSIFKETFLKTDKI